jgi:cell division protein FtsZ
VIDDSLGDEVRVTVIAAGFESATPTQKELEPTGFRPPK